MFVEADKLLKMSSAKVLTSTSAEAEEAGGRRALWMTLRSRMLQRRHGPSETNESEEDAVSAPASPAETSLANDVFPRVVTPCPPRSWAGALGGPGMGSGI